MTQCIIDNRLVVLDVLDTAGQEGIPAYTVRDSVIRLGEGFLLVYSIKSRQSFEFLNWVHSQIVRVKSSMLTNTEDVPIVIVGNKCDLEGERQVGMDEGQELARQFGCKFLETSAKEDINVEQAFLEVAREIKRRNSLAQQGSMALADQELRRKDVHADQKKFIGGLRGKTDQEKTCAMRIHGTGGTQMAAADSEDA
ncbi:hypothetical protein D9758_011262 [Tetrapyrgos nigripes]|uniref:Uncharacterized protein n=1 Tax=Tetrapyrgos nigripes TaxID=182062 RepID=A0A8H5CUR7_9AGAR|nr:hypothetical protein D9758_011262 [Tetrapyrgos nigripes]